MIKIATVSIVVCCSLLPSFSANGQIVREFIRDYFQQVPRQYSPNDPWQMGRILRTEVGHYGHFYNCDGEESKRNSPYINWNQQNTDCRLHEPIKGTIRQQIAEIQQRIRWGSCGQGCQCADCVDGSHESFESYGTPVISEAIGCQCPDCKKQLIEQSEVQLADRALKAAQQRRIANSPKTKSRRLVDDLLRDAGLDPNRDGRNAVMLAQVLKESRSQQNQAERLETETLFEIDETDAPSLDPNALQQPQQAPVEVIQQETPQPQTAPAPAPREQVAELPQTRRIPIDRSKYPSKFYRFRR